MRTNSRMTKKVVRNIAAMMILVLCFAAVFITTLTFGIKSDIDMNVEDTTTAPIAKAEDFTSSNSGALTWGKANPITVPGVDDDKGAAIFGAAGASATATSWTYSMNLNDIAPTASGGAPNNHQLWKSGGDNGINGGDNPMYTSINVKNVWAFGPQEANNANQTGFSMAVAIPGFIKTLVDNSNFNVTVSASVLYYDRMNNSDTLYYNWLPVSNDNIPTAQSYWDNRANGSSYGNSSTNVTFSKNNISVPAGSESIAFGLAWDFGYVMGSAKHRRVYLKNFTYTFNISLNTSFTEKTADIQDGSAPVKLSAYYDSAKTEVYNPLISDVANLPMYYSNIATQLAGNVDSKDANGNYTLKSYASQSLGYVPGLSYSYYKYAKLEFADTYNYNFDGQVSASGDNSITGSNYRYKGLGGFSTTNGTTFTASNTNRNKYFAAGIRSVTVTGAANKIDVASMNDGNTTSTTALTVNGVTVGYVRLTKTNRNRVTVELYMRADSTINITVSDGYNDSDQYSTVFGGIDGIAPGSSYNNGTNLDKEEYVFKTADELNGAVAKWVRNANFSAPTSTDRDSDTGKDYVWFYTVERKDTIAELKSQSPIRFSNYFNHSGSDTAASIRFYHDDMLPIAYKNFTSFRYDFANGVADGVGGVKVGNPSALINDRVTGAGYYRFNFYITDVAGNLGQQQSFYVKVDYDVANYDLDFSYIDKNNQKQTITADKTGEWATGDLTLRFTIDNLCFSGNTFRLTDASDADFVFAFNREKFLSINGNAVADNAGSFTVKTRIEDATLLVTYTVVRYNAAGEVIGESTVDKDAVRWQGIVSIKIAKKFNGEFPTAALVTPFVLYTGIYDSATAMDDDGDRLNWTDTNWKKGNVNGVHVYLDAVAPDAPELIGQSYFKTGVNGYSTVFTDREWKTDGYQLDLQLIFSDDVANDAIADEYKSGIRVFAGFKHINSQADFDALKELGIDSKRNYLNITTENWRDYFDRLDTPNMTQLSNNMSDFSITFLSANGSGLRVIYIWVVDQAGNCSGLATYHVLVDPTGYRVTSSVVANAIFGQQAGIEVTNSDNEEATVFHRGDTVNFKFSVTEGFVPYTFVKTQKGNAVTLFDNFSPRKSLAITNNPYASLCKLGDLPGVDGNEYTLSFVLDDLDDLSNLIDTTAVGLQPGISTVQFDFAVRQVITRNITDRNKFYDTQQYDVSKYLTFNITDEATLAKLLEKHHFEYLDKDSNPIEAPVKVGSYSVRIYVAKDDDSFVVDKDFDANGQYRAQVENFNVLEGRVIVTVTPTSSTYGDRIILDYTVSGFDKANDKEHPMSTGEYFDGSLKLAAIANFTPDSLVDIGATYAITYDKPFVIRNSDGTVSKNYNVTFASTDEATVYHTITQRRIEVLVWEEHKQYGNTDPAIRFGVDTGKFEWYTSKGESFTLDSVLGKIFAAYAPMGEQVYDGASYRLYNSGGRITREAGENVGEYSYNAPSTLDVDNNFTVTVQTTRYFYIDRRNVVLGVGGQSSVLPNGQTPDASTIVIVPSVAAIDNAFKDEILRAIEGKLSVKDGEKQPTAPDGYSEMWYFEIMLGVEGDNNTILTTNFSISIGSGEVYIIYIAGGDAVILNLKADAVFGAIFGDIWTADLLNYLSIKDNFTVQGIDESEFDDISWTVSIADATFGTYISAGSHRVTVSDAKLLKDGNELDRLVFVDGFSLDVSPVEIIVRPKAVQFTKTYGDTDDAFGIGYEIVSVNGTTTGEYAGYTYARLAELIGSGKFARGRYAYDGALRGIANSRLDDATDTSGVIVKGETGDFYSFAVSEAFAINDTNFTIKTSISLESRFIVVPKTINLYVSNFVGINKVFSGDKTVDFGNTLAYDVTSELASAQDDVKLAYKAEYEQVGSLEHVTEVGIEFTNLSIVGADVANYRLGIIYNNNTEDRLYKGTSAVSQAEIADDIMVVIYYIDNINNINKIHISMGAIAILKTDFTISKRYDNTTDLTMDAITIANTKNDRGGSTLLWQIWNNGNGGVRIVNTPSFSGTEVARYTVDVTLFFPLKGVTKDGIDIATDGIYNDPDIIIDIDEEQGIRVHLNFMTATITQRVLGADDFVSITPQNQDYSAQSRVMHTDYVLADSALAAGDSQSSVGLNIVTAITGSDFGVGERDVAIAEMGTGVDHTSVSDKNYSVDVASLNERFSNLSVIINRAKLMPNVSFKDKYYDGSSDVEFALASGTGEFDLTTLNYPTYLRNELSKLRIDGNVTYKLSANGKIDDNVATDADGKVIAHNVMVQGLRIVVDGDAKLLNNYEIYGSRYTGNGYSTVGTVTSGVIDDYEMLGAVTVWKTDIKILANNVIIKDKVYDGTRDVDVRILLENSGVVKSQEDKLYVEANGTFTKSFVNDNVPITISGVRLMAVDGYEYLLNNYVLNEYKDRRTANIVARPVTVNADLGEKVYNGSAQINANSLSFSLNGLLPQEDKNYVVKAAEGAFYFDKNVNVERNADGSIPDIIKVLAKEGAIYKPTLINNISAKSNYKIVVSSKQKLGEDYIAYVDENGALHYDEKYEGDKEVVYYYDLPTADKYILATDTDKYTAAKEAGAIVSTFIYDGKTVYAVDSAYQGEVSDTMPAVTYIKGEGIITQKSVSISASAIEINPDSKAFVKMYDGTRKFFGVNGTDYKYNDEEGIIGVVRGDVVKIDQIKAEFDDAYTTAHYIVFTPSGLQKVGDYYNYKVDGASGSARKPASITKRPIDAILKDGEMVYDTAINTITADLEYKLHGNGGDRHDLVLWENGFYLPFDEYTQIMGSGLGDYQDSLRSRMYTANPNGGFDAVPVESDLGSDMSIYFIKLSGITSLPTVSATFSTSKPNVGDQSLSYTVNNVTVNNYAFNPVYDGKIAGKSVLTVVPRDIFIGTDGSVYNKFYAGNDPEVELQYYNANGGRGFVSENAMQVFRINGTDYYPTVVWVVYNTVTGKIVREADKYAVISDDLGANEVYLASFKAPQGVDYADLIKNYNIHLGTGFVTVNDGDAQKLMLAYAGTDFKSNASVLNLTQPTTIGVTLRSSENNTFNEVYDGTDHTANILLGLLDGDEITIEDANGVELEKKPIDAGTYTGVIKVKRAIKVDADDPNTYFNLWSSQANVTIVIAKASPRLTAVTTSKYYDGIPFEYGLSGANNMIGYLDNGEVNIKSGHAEIKYEMQDGDKFVDVNELLNAGVYRVTVSLNDKFEESNPNYAKETAVATYTILKAVVNVSISSEGYTEKPTGGSVKRLAADYEQGKQYAISYDVNMADSPASIAVPKSQTKVVFEKEINSSGLYPFAIVMTDGELSPNNYRFANANGVLELSTNHVSTGGSELTIVDKKVVANEFVATPIFKETSSGSDTELWLQIDKYMPHINSRANLASVVKLGLYYDGQLVQLDGTSFNVVVAIPRSVGNMDDKVIYTVTKDGNLKRLTDYTITEDGKISYTTDYLGALVFVDFTSNLLPTWQIVLISLAIVFVVIATVWTVTAYIIRKKQLKKLV